MPGTIDINLGNGYVLSIDPVASVLIICSVIAVFLILTVLTVIVLFKQKSLLKSIDRKLSDGPSAPMAAPAETYSIPLSFTPPPQPGPRTCPSCGTPAASDNVFCQKCGARL